MRYTHTCEPEQEAGGGHRHWLHRNCLCAHKSHKSAMEKATAAAQKIANNKRDSSGIAKMCVVGCEGCVCDTPFAPPKC